MKAILLQNKKIIATSLISILSFVIFYDTWHSIIDIWIRSETFAHGFIIAPISLWLIWTRRSTLKNLEPEYAWLALVFILLNGLTWLMADLINALVIKQFAAVGLLISPLWFYLGNRITYIIIFPLLFLYLMVPVGEALFPYLMEFTANFTVKMLRLTGISVYQEGLVFTLPTGNWSVIEACSGLRYLIASATLGLVYAYINYTKFYKRLIFSLVAIIVPIIANGFRAYMIVMIGHLSDMKLAVGIDHVIYGAVFFGVVMLLLFFIGSIWSENPVTKQEFNETNSDNSLTIKSSQYTSNYLATVLTLILASLVIWPIGSEWLKSRYNSDLSINQVTDIQFPQPWQLIDKANWRWKPTLSGAKVESINYLSDRNNTVAILQANFGNESQENELVNSSNNINRLTGNSWSLAYTKKIPIEQFDGSLEYIDQSLLKGFKENENINMLIYSWYQIGKTATSNPYIAKLNQLIKRLILDESPETFIILMTESNDIKHDNEQIILSKIAPLLSICNICEKK